MAYICIKSSKECDGCGRCQEQCTEPGWDYVQSFTDETDKICEAINDNLRALRELFEEYTSRDIDDLEDDLRVTEKALKEMESGLAWIY